MHQHHAHPEVRETDIAVIGMACRFPGANDIAQFWENLRRGVESITVFREAELAQPDAALRTHPNYVKAGAVVPAIDQFDAAFFGYSPSEAALLDPQQRFFLECAWEALEDAGCPPEGYGGRIGVFAGAGLNSYLMNQIAVQRPFAETTLAATQALLANNHDFLPMRVSYKFNLRGPSVNVQTACSTGLVVVHLACQSLLMGECEMALAGSASLAVPQESGYLFEEGMVQSPDGHCRPFDAAAQGTVFGNGVGVVVLKLLTQALEDGDPIIAVVKGSAINNDGANKVSFTAPCIAGQAVVITDALAVAGVDARTISYLEAHSTGTKLGDPAEIAGLVQAFAQSCAGADLPRQYCAIGSVKGNIGHLSETAGVAGLIKTLLMLQHGELVPTLHVTQPNPLIDFARSPFYLHTSLSPWIGWRDGAEPPVRRAGVSSFGMGGTNAHVVLEAAPVVPEAPREEPRPLHVLPIAAKNGAALDAYVQAYIAYLDRHPEVNLGDLCYTAQVGRSPFAHRLSVVAGSVEELRARLAAEPTVRGVAGKTSPTVAFLFTGQGSQYAGMGLDLDATAPPFREALDACAAILDPLLNRPLRAILRDPAVIDQTTFTQPALFALEYALAKLWHAWGVEPDILIGHSVGEVVAACLAGVFNLEDGLTLVAARGRLMGALPPDGAMVAIAAAESQVREAIAPYPEDVAIAAVNGPTSVVISGRTEPVQALAAQFAANGVRTQALTVSHAFHSPLLDPMLADFRAVAERITYHAPTRHLVSNLTGRLAGAEVALADYWVRHVREAVRFGDGVQTLHAQGVDIFLEIGPKPVLLGMVEQGMEDGRSGIGGRGSGIGDRG